MHYFSWIALCLCVGLIDSSEAQWLWKRNTITMTVTQTETISRCIQTRAGTKTQSQCTTIRSNGSVFGTSGAYTNGTTIPTSTLTISQACSCSPAAGGLMSVSQQGNTGAGNAGAGIAGAIVTSALVTTVPSNAAALASASSLASKSSADQAAQGSMASIVGVMSQRPSASQTVSIGGSGRSSSQIQQSASSSPGVSYSKTSAPSYTFSNYTSSPMNGLTGTSSTHTSSSSVVASAASVQSSLISSGVSSALYSGPFRSIATGSSGSASAVIRPSSTTSLGLPTSSQGYGATSTASTRSSGGLFVSSTQLSTGRSLSSVSKPSSMGSSAGSSTLLGQTALYPTTVSSASSTVLAMSSSGVSTAISGLTTTVSVGAGSSNFASIASLNSRVIQNTLSTASSTDVSSTVSTNPLTSINIASSQTTQASIPIPGLSSAIASLSSDIVGATSTPATPEATPGFLIRAQTASQEANGNYAVVVNNQIVFTATVPGDATEFTLQYVPDNGMNRLIYNGKFASIPGTTTVDPVEFVAAAPGLRRRQVANGFSGLTCVVTADGLGSPLLSCTAGPEAVQQACGTGFYMGFDLECEPLVLVQIDPTGPDAVDNTESGANPAGTPTGTFSLQANNPAVNQGASGGFYAIYAPYTGTSYTLLSFARYQGGVPLSLDADGHLLGIGPNSAGATVSYAATFKVGSTFGPVALMYGAIAAQYVPIVCQINPPTAVTPVSSLSCVDGANGSNMILQMCGSSLYLGTYVGSIGAAPNPVQNCVVATFKVTYT